VNDDRHRTHDTAGYWGHHYHGEFTDNGPATMLGCAMLLTIIIIITAVAVIALRVI
jgi:hypothetical protein